MPRKQEPGKFWPQVRAMIWEKAQELYQMEQAKKQTRNHKSVRYEIGTAAKSPTG